MADTREKRDLVLAPGTYAYMQDVTTGAVKTFVGPCVINQTAQEVPVVYAPRDGTFHRCNALEEAVRRSPIAVEGFYLMLKNPANREGEEHPARGSSGKIAPELQVGRKVNIPGPCMFALWPGQDAQGVRGHHLRSNQYLLVRVYNEEEARTNWGKAVVKPAEGLEGGEGAPLATAPAPPELTVGKLLIIKGTEVSFYIPPTGIGVVPEGRDSEGKVRYVRDALTLERLEYCILVDEDGRKRYERGPKVVFPAPTETFIERTGQRKFRAIELNEIQGLHIKVIAPYVDEKTHQEYREGDELFITGKETAIYFPREEHSSISYDGKAKHFATAIPPGEARYVMDRVTGEIDMAQGPAMLLPDPRNKVIVRRVLSDKQVLLWYPGNGEALEYNQHLRALLTSVPTTRQGAISEGDYERGTRKAKRELRRMVPVQSTAEMDKAITGDQDLVADEFTRASTYTQPRTVTLDTKFQGVPSIDIWTGYAMMIVSKTGTRRVVQGPTTVLLHYDESLEVLDLSTGRPKSADETLQTVFLRTVANKVSDVIEVETSDHVRVEVTLSHKVNFEGESGRWFDVENYVQFLCDHVRSVLKGAIKKVKIEEFYARSVDIIRDVILGPSTREVGEETHADRSGMTFRENSMRVADVEVLQVRIFDERIRGLLDQAQHQVVKSNIEVSGAQRELELTRRMEEIARETASSKQETRMLLMELTDMLGARQHQIQMKQVARGGELDQSEHTRQLKAADQKGQVSVRETETEMAVHGANLQRQRDDQQLQQEMIASQTQSVVQQATAISPHLVTALERLADEKLLSSLAAGFGEFAAAKGVGLLASARQFFDFLPDDKLRVLRHVGGKPAKEEQGQ